MITYNDLEPSEKVKIYDKGVSFTDDRSKSRKCALVIVRETCGRRSSMATKRYASRAEHFVDCIKAGKTPITDGKLGLRIRRTELRLLRALWAAGERPHIRDEIVPSLRAAAKRGRVSGCKPCSKRQQRDPDLRPSFAG